MKTYLIIIATTFLIISTYSCNKTKTISNRFIKTGEWVISKLTVDGISEEELPIWEIEDCDVYNESCYAEWKNEEGGHAEFIWQFREKANTLEISHQITEEEDEHHEEHDHSAEEAAEQAYIFSGVYEVIEKKKNEMEFSSENTVGYLGQKVIIKIQKK